MPRKRVFYEDWQMECCGTPFAVGDEVAWRLVAHDAEGVREGHGYGAEAWVENHGGPDQETAGRVRAIDLVHQEYLAYTDQRALERLDRAREPSKTRGPVILPSPYSMEPVPGAHTLEAVDTCPKWFEHQEPGRDPGPHRIRRAQGVLVTLELPDGTPPEPGDPR
ncbi:hypothetical protein FB563_4623 [Streptomyces puniciscabiei]|uniref:Uncharacterized protein n=1 Tax=Streptomyces puniciscabiei TaxID=164348 RepID=A0A542UKE6_9ACTN|nr:DUF6578 domain-containing protein [Streptomyces puniciscabiei]TQK99545.1 hypothetical protein FB563_4623 [Streptomyces puniciscabiei]